MQGKKEVSEEMLDEIWEKDFSFLKTGNLEMIYLALLNMAKIEGELESIYAALPNNCQILLEDFLKLKEFWNKYFYFSNKMIAKAWALFRLCSFHQENACGFCASRYYLKKLKDKSQGNSEDFQQVYLHHYRILSTKYRSGHGYKHFFANIFDFHFKIGCFITKDHQNITVFFSVWEYDLNQGIVYKLLKYMPKYTLVYKLVSTEKGREINFCYNLPVKKLITKLTPADHKDYIATDGFLAEITNDLKKIGIPIEDNVIQKIE